MHLRDASVLASVLTLSTFSLAGDTNQVAKPRLDVRAAPRVALSPVNVVVVAELKGGDDLEEFYCPGTVWDWNDGSKSFNESDCPPFESGGRIERRFSNEHRYRRAGSYTITVTMTRASRSVARATANVTVRVAGYEP